MEGTGIWVTIVYGSCHLLLAFILAIVIYVLAKKKGDELSPRVFVLRIWKMRGVYTPLIIHIYDTATDIGVLYEWSKLAHNEKTKGINYESLDMTTLFWTAIGFMITYRSILGLLGCYTTPLLVENYLKWVNFDKSRGHGCVLSTIKYLFWLLIGFIGGALECGIFVGIFVEQTGAIEKQKKMKVSVNKEFADNNNKETYYLQTLNDQSQCAGVVQKLFQLAEGCLESLPEAIMQSVFLIRSYNDPILRKEGGSTEFLIIISVLASILSIANKYVWIDELMVNTHCKCIIISLKTLVKQLTYEMIKLLDIKDSIPEATFNAIKVTCNIIGDVVYQHMKTVGKSKKANENKNDSIDVLTLKSINWSNINITDIMIDVAKSEEDELFDLSITDSDRVKIAGVINTTVANNAEWLDKYYEAIGKEEYKNKWIINAFFCLKQLDGKHFLSLGFIIRLIWRLSAVTSRFVIFSLIWAVLGGAFEVLLLLVMIVLWYLTMTIHIHYISKLNSESIEMNMKDPYLLERAKWKVQTLKKLLQDIKSKRNITDRDLVTPAQSINLDQFKLKELGLLDNIDVSINYDSLDAQDDRLRVYQDIVIVRVQQLETQIKNAEKATQDFKNRGYCTFCCNLVAAFRLPQHCGSGYNCVCGVIIKVFAGFFWYSMVLVMGLLVGIVFQLGLLFITGRGLYILRMFENVAIMIVITFFAWNSSIDCNFCVDPRHRSAQKNARVFIWIIIGWSAVVIHILTSFVVTKMIEKDYGVSMDDISQQISLHVHKVMVDKQMKAEQM